MLAFLNGTTLVGSSSSWIYLKRILAVVLVAQNLVLSKDAIWKTIARATSLVNDYAKYNGQRQGQGQLRQQGALHLHSIEGMTIFQAIIPSDHIHQLYNDTQHSLTSPLHSSSSSSSSSSNRNWNCSPTSEIRIDVVPKNPTNTNATGPAVWILQTLDAHGQPKEVGGDEFYISYTRTNHHENTSTVPANTMIIDPVTHEAVHHPTYVGIPTDLGNGQYQLEFFTPPLSPDEQQSQQQEQQQEQQQQEQGSMTIHLTFTCGMGLVTQKSDWKSRGALDWMHVQPNVSLPPWKPFVPPAMPPHPLNMHAGSHPNAAAINATSNNDTATTNDQHHPGTAKTKTLSKYDYLAVFGDSIMGLFIGQYNQNKAFNRYSKQGLNFPTKQMGVHFEGNIRMPYAGHVEDLKKLFTKWHGPHILKHQEQQPQQPNTASTNTAILLGSGSWDLGMITWMGGEENFTVDPTLEAYRQFITWLKAEYPKTAIYWKSLSASHPHAVSVSQFALETPPDRIAQIQKGTMYLSAARSSALDEATRTVMESLDVPILDVTQATQLSAEWLFPADGAHFRWEMNRYMFMEWFY